MDGCAAYAVGCAAYAVGCAAYAVGSAAYVRSVRIRLTKSSLAEAWTELFKRLLGLHFLPYYFLPYGSLLGQYFQKMGSIFGLKSLFK